MYPLDDKKEQQQLNELKQSITQSIIRIIELIIEQNKLEYELQNLQQQLKIANDIEANEEKRFVMELIIELRARNIWSPKLIKALITKIKQKVKEIAVTFHFESIQQQISNTNQQIDEVKHQIYILKQQIKRFMNEIQQLIVKNVVNNSWYY